MTIKTLTNEEILKRAIEKAAGNGYRLPFCRWQECSELNKTNYTKPFKHQKLFFSHEFAKAFWGEESCYDEHGVPRTKDGVFFLNLDVDNAIVWKWHLQQMVIEKEPLKYIEKFIKED